MNDEFQNELEKLEEIITSYQEVIDYTDQTVKTIPQMYKDNEDLMMSLLSQAEIKLVNLNKGLLKPYFARIDFTDNNKHNDVCYIGKVGVLDPDNKIITVDWRAPISTLYYDSNVGQTSYEAPQGIINGSLNLKRQFEIVNGKLLSFQDIDTVSNDELLKPYLGVNADNRLKNIVASIQSEQNAIIREKLWKNIIVQGVAGSGKTTVALHRIAYLVYNYRDLIKSDQYMVIGPNKFFINYISSVLPDLDVSNVPQLTYEELAQDFVGEPFEINDSSNKLMMSVNGKRNYIDRYKTSITYKQAIDRFLIAFEKTLIPDNDLVIRGFKILSRSVILKTYNEMSGYATDDLQAKVDRCILLLGKIIDCNYSKLLLNLNNFTSNNFNKNRNNSESSRKNQKDYTFIKKELQKSCRQSLRQYFSKVNTKVLALYTSFITNFEDYEEGDVILLKNETLNNLKKKTLDFEDLAAVMYLKERLKGTGKYDKYRHTVIDEAQDFGEFNFYVLKKIMTNCTFSIFGDLAQAIYSYRSIDNWQLVIEKSFDNNCEIQELLKSYRTTVEIMAAANHVTRYIGLNTANPVIRHGNPVIIDKVIKADIAKYTYNKIKDFIDKGYKSIAIICKTDEDSGKLNLALKELGMDINHISSSDEPYVGGVCTMPSYLSKGLEFDAVILNNVTEENYDSKFPIDMKLLYVSMTRSLHELVLTYDSEITLPLRDLL